VLIDTNCSAWAVRIEKICENECGCKSRSEVKMKISARNSLKGKVTAIVPGAVNTEVTVEVAPGVEVVSIITKSSAETLGLTVGSMVYAVVKSSDVMIATE
jgi:molybdopterin-binding protein